MVICGFVGFLIERFAYRPLRKAPRINVLITAIGISLLLQNVGQLKEVFGPDPQSMPGLIPNITLISIPFGDAADKAVKIGLVDVVIFITSGVLMFALEFVVFRTKLGAAMRAVSFSTENAALMGIPVDRVISLTFVIGSSLAAAAGFLNSMKYSLLNQPAHTQWVLLGLKAFVAAVIGGIGNIRGAVLGGFIIAAVEQFGGFYISSSYRDVYVFGLLILILLVRPSGLLGTTVREKV
jgi:branched-chain amino acid transport system permease protein